MKEQIKELNPCPFCKNEVILTGKPSNDDTLSFYHIHHKHNIPCGIRFTDTDKDMMIKMWNDVSLPPSEVTDKKEDIIFNAVDSFRGDNDRWVVLKHKGNNTHYYRYDIVHKIIETLQHLPSKGAEKNISKETLLKVVDSCFHKFASEYRHEAVQEAVNILQALKEKVVQ